MAIYHYLGTGVKIGETLWYVATWRDYWLALISLSAAVLKCGVRDIWVGWGFSHPVRPPQARGQQQSLFDSATRPIPERGLARTGAGRAACGGGLAAVFRPSAIVAGNVCRPPPVPWLRVPCCELARVGAHARLSPYSGRLQ